VLNEAMEACEVSKLLSVQNEMHDDVLEAESAFVYQQLRRLNF
jgi:hypothetical protein